MCLNSYANHWTRLQLSAGKGQPSLFQSWSLLLFFKRALLWRVCQPQALERTTVYKVSSIVCTGIKKGKRKKSSLLGFWYVCSVSQEAVTEKLWRACAHPAWCFYNLTRGLGPSSLSQKPAGFDLKPSMCPAKFICSVWQSWGATLSSGSHGPAREEGTGTASRQRNGECAPPRTSTISSWARGNPWCDSYLLGSLLLGTGAGKSEDADINSSQSVVSPPQVEQLNCQALSLLESPVYLQNQLSAKITTEARFDSAQLSTAIPHTDPTLSLGVKQLCTTLEITGSSHPPAVKRSLAPG